MSRSVRQDYDKLRAPKPGETTDLFAYAREGLQVAKFVGVVRFSEEQIFDMRAETDGRYVRKAESYNVSPTNEDWAKYHRAQSGLLALRNYENTVGLEEVEIPIPRPETHIRFTETHEAWLERCRALDAEQEAA